MTGEENLAKYTRPVNLMSEIVIHEDTRLVFFFFEKMILLLWGSECKTEMRIIMTRRR